MDWNLAFDAMSDGLKDLTDSDLTAVDAMLMAVFDLCLAQRAAEPYGGCFTDLPLEELEPGFENTWDYEWPTDFPPPHD